MSRKVLNGDAKLLLAQVRPLQHLLLKEFQLVRGGLRSVRAAFLVLEDRRHDVLLDVLEESLDEGGANITDASLEPDIVVQEVSLTSEDGKVNCKVVVLAVHNWHQALLHLLGDVKDPGQVHDPLIVPAEFADGSDHQSLVILPQGLQDQDGVNVITQELGKQERQELVNHQTALIHLA